MVALMDADGDNGVAYQMIKKHWDTGIESVENVMYMNLFQLTGRPFVAPLIGLASSAASANSRRAFCNILGRMDEMGIKLITTAYLGKTFTRTTFFFQRSVHNTHDQDPPTPAEERFLCVGIRSASSVIVPAVPAFCRMPLGWVRAEFGSQLVQEEVGEDFMELSFDDYPFAPCGAKFEALVTAKRLFLGLVRQLAARGYEFAAPMSLKGGARNDTFFFRAARRPIQPDTKYFFISCEEKCRLRLFECPTEVIDEVRAAITFCSIKEIKRPYLGCSEIVMNGQPFNAPTETLAETQLDILDIIRSLWAIGYKLVGNLQTTLNTQERAVMLFESTNDSPQPLFGIGFAECDTLRLLNAPTNARTIIRETILGLWAKGIQEEFDVARGHGIKLKGRPFGARDVSAESQHGLHLVVCLVEMLARAGWRLRTALELGGRTVSEGEHAFVDDCALLVFVGEAAPNGTERVHGA